MSTSTADTRDISIFLEVMKLDHYGDVLISKGFTIDNLHLATASDLDKLRITNKRDRACLLGAINLLKDEANMSPEDKGERRRARAAMVRNFNRTVGPTERRAAERKRKKEIAAEDGTVTDGKGQGVVMEVLADGNVAVNLDDDAEPEVPPFTATFPTANEHARQATIYLAHHRVDRAWPKAGSKLSQTLHLSGAAPATYEPLYSINVDGCKESVCPPHKSSQGYSAKFCKTCADFVSEAMQGAWQFQVIEQVLIGVGLYEEVPVWKPFNQTESMKIEYAHKRKQPSVKIGKTLVDFDTLLWGTKPIRRVDTDAVPFPTLKRKDLVCAPDKSIGPQQEIAGSIQQLQRTLVSETEERRSRLYIEQQEQRALVQVLADIAAIMDQYHFEQRAELEEEERIAREKWEGDEFDRALDKMYEWEEQSVRDVALRKWERESERIMRNQYSLLEEMEAVARKDVENEEEAFRANLNKLMSLFNEQVREFLDRKRKKELRSKKNGDGKPRCPICRKFDCDFFCHPWKGQWKQHGGALDPPPAKEKADETLSTLVNRANEHEYDEFLINTKAMRQERKAKKTLKEYLTSSHKPPAPMIAGRGDTNPSSPSNGTNGAHDITDITTIGQSIQRNSPESISRDVDDDSKFLQRAASAQGADNSKEGGDTSPQRARPQSAQSTRSASQSALHGRSIFRSIIAPSKGITADSINSLTKRSQLRVVRAVSASIGR